MLLGDFPSKAEYHARGGYRGFTVQIKSEFRNRRKAKEIAIASGQVYARVKGTPFVLSKLNWEGLDKTKRWKI